MIKIVNNDNEVLLFDLNNVCWIEIYTDITYIYMKSSREDIQIRKEDLSSKLGLYGSIIAYLKKETVDWITIVSEKNPNRGNEEKFVYILNPKELCYSIPHDSGNEEALIFTNDSYLRVTARDFNKILEHYKKQKDLIEFSSYSKGE